MTNLLSRPLHIRTPTYYSNKLSQLTGKDIWLKLEPFQPVGSYKIRGIGRLCQYYLQQGAEHFVASSAGNAGYTVAYIARLLSKKSTVFVPENSLSIYLDAIKNLGSQIQLAGRSWDEANAAAQLYCQEQQAAFIPPFDHPLIWHGHATMIDEIFADGIVPDAIVAAVGGGGLACGLCEGLHQYGRDDITIIAAETHGAASFATSSAAGEIIKFEKLDTIALTLATQQVTSELLKWQKKRPILNQLVSDQQALRACQQFLDDQRLLVEPASGTALAIAYSQLPTIAPFQKIVIIVCGGIGVTQQQLMLWENQLAAMA